MGRQAEDFSDGLKGGGGHSVDAQAGRQARAERVERDRRIEAGVMARAVAELNSINNYPTSTPSHLPSEPATFAGTVKGMAIAGIVVAIIYAYIGLSTTSWVALAIWGVQGLVVGAIAGVGLYIIIKMLRAAMWVLAVIFQFVFWGGVIMVLHYIFSLDY